MLQKTRHGRAFRTQRQAQEAGFTLVELLVTMIVLGIIIASMAGLYWTMQVMQVQSQHLDMANRAARTEIENLRNNGYNNLTPGSTINFTSSLPTNLPKDKQGLVAVSQPVTDLRRVDVTITYTDYGKTQKITLSSNIGIIGIGQGQ
jgi:prepilin-type N-terminal cleavage/methylation domain-containing protein